MLRQRRRQRAGAGAEGNWQACHRASAFHQLRIAEGCRRWLFKTCSQDEIDALLHGVDDGLVDTESDSEPGSIKSYDLTSQDRIVRGRMPTLE